MVMNELAQFHSCSCKTLKQMMTPDRTATEFYAFFIGADYSFLRMKKTLWQARCHIGILYLDELEKKFREIFDLTPFANEAQDKPVNFTDFDGAFSKRSIS